MSASNPCLRCFLSRRKRWSWRLPYLYDSFIKLNLFGYVQCLQVISRRGRFYLVTSLVCILMGLTDLTNSHSPTSTSKLTVSWSLPLRVVQTCLNLAAAPAIITWVYQDRISWSPLSLRFEFSNPEDLHLALNSLQCSHQWHSASSELDYPLSLHTLGEAFGVYAVGRYGLENALVLAKGDRDIAIFLEQPTKNACYLPPDKRVDNRTQ